MNPKTSTDMISIDEQCAAIKLHDIDWSGYIALYGITSQDPVKHYAENWRNLTLNIPGFFNVEFYLFHYKDVQNYNASPLQHFLLHGQPEGRYGLPSKYSHGAKGKKYLNQRDRDFALLQDFGLDWSEYKSKYHFKSTDEAISHYLKNWKIVEPTFGVFFDTAFYISNNPDIIGNIPLIHFLRFGIKEGRKGIQRELTEFEKINQTQSTDLYLRLTHLDVNWATLCLDDKSLITSIDNCAYYCSYWQEKNFILTGIFNQQLYLELYPDIAAAAAATGMNPLEHFWNNGRAEGRCAYFDIDSFIEKGHVKYDEKKKTIVIVSHESSATGAPLVGYSLGQHFADKSFNYNVIHWVLKQSKIHDAFLENSCVVVTGAYREGKSLTQKLLTWLQDNYSIYALISNSAESVLVLEAASDMDIITVALIHEFSEYVRPYGKIARSAMAADRVIVPAEIIKQSLITDLGRAFGKKPDPGNIIVMPQGKIPDFPSNNGENLSTDTLKKKLKLDEDCKLIIGAGYVQVRKGVDLFVTLAEKIRDKYQDKCKFVWVGGGYDPKEDLQFSVWLETQINSVGLTRDFIFLDHQRTLDNILELADVFVLPSRLDPFPNVIVDALAANVHVSCFENATGCAEFMKSHDADATIAKHLNVDDMSDKIVARLNLGDINSSINSEIVKKYLSFSKYTQNIINIFKDAESCVNQRKRIEKNILQSKAFDEAFYGFDMSLEESVRHYVRAASKGLNVSNPRPGFSDLRWLSLNKFEKFNSKTGFRIPFDDAIQAKKLTTHDCLTINTHSSGKKFNKSSNKQIAGISTSAEAMGLKMKYAIHIHLHYPELAEEFADYASHLPGKFDVLLTFNANEHVGTIKDLFSGCGAEKVITATYDNIGRDVAPFIKVMTGIYDQYEVVGHFHSKKSLDYGDGIGDSWRRFLLETLIGQKHQILEILRHFEKNPQLGLLMAEDRHVVGFATNKPFADRLCNAIGIDFLKNADLYPLGTMFWARTKAIQPLLDLDIDSFLDPEPLPYDGSYMHAIERLLPHFVETSGYKVKSIHVPGLNW